MLLAHTSSSNIKCARKLDKHGVLVCEDPELHTWAVLLPTAAGGGDLRHGSLVHAALTQVEIRANHALVTRPSKVCHLTQVADHPENDTQPHWAAIPSLDLT